MLVNEVHKPLARQKGYYLSGKFEQFMSAAPYSVFVQVSYHITSHHITSHHIISYHIILYRCYIY